MLSYFEIDEDTLVDAEKTVGAGPISMVNLLRFRKEPDYPSGFVGSFRDSRAGYYEGYVGSFLQASAEVGVVPELAYAGSRATDILAGPHDLWDDIAIVRYKSFSDLRRILISPYYLQCAKPHQVAVLADWRFFVTRER